MYHRHDLPYRYPEKCDEHMIDVKHLRDVDLDKNELYLQKYFWFKCQRGLLRVCQYTVLPLVVWVRHGLYIHGKEKRKQHKALFKDGLMTVSNYVIFASWRPCGPHNNSGKTEQYDQYESPPGLLDFVEGF